MIPICNAISPGSSTFKLCWEGSHFPNLTNDKQKNERTNAIVAALSLILSLSLIVLKGGKSAINHHLT